MFLCLLGGVFVLRIGGAGAGEGIGEFKEYFMAKLQDTRKIIEAESLEFEQVTKHLLLLRAVLATYGSSIDFRVCVHDVVQIGQS